MLSRAPCAARRQIAASERPGALDRWVRVVWRPDERSSFLNTRWGSRAAAPLWLGLGARSSHVAYRDSVTKGHERLARVRRRCELDPALLMGTWASSSGLPARATRQAATWVTNAHATTTTTTTTAAAEAAAAAAAAALTGTLRASASSLAPRHRTARTQPQPQQHSRSPALGRRSK
ncbi:unnamed protein product [Boreogadus saida]